MYIHKITVCRYKSVSHINNLPVDFRGIISLITLLYAIEKMGYHFGVSFLFFFYFLFLLVRSFNYQ